MQAQERRLRDRIEELEETIRQLREPLPPAYRLPRQWGLTPREADLLIVLFTARLPYSHRDAIMDAMYGGLDDQANDRIIDVWINKIRKKLKPFGIRVESKWGHGYGLSEGTKQIIRNSLLPDGRSP
jgi:two-component system, cell cycle response regulator CtrA